MVSQWRINTVIISGEMDMTGHKARVRAGIALALALTLIGGSTANATELLGPKTTYIVSVDGDFNDVVRTQLGCLLYTSDAADE